jgi:microcompartment protein CcmK/EutM
MCDHGSAWLLLGALRLHLICPPRGIDPAGKYLLAVQHYRREISDHLDAEGEVRRAMAVLPGGHDETRLLEGLSSARKAMEAKLRAVAAKVVPRPRPSQYTALAAEVAGFLKSLGESPECPCTQFRNP